VLRVAGAASGGKGLVRVVCRRVVASQASLVAGVFKEPSRRLRMAQVALLCKHSVCLRQRATRIRLLTTFNSLSSKPKQRETRHDDGQPEAPAPQRMRARKVLQINSLGELFSSPRASQHDVQVLKL
jgi:hypothetical protein